MKCNMKYFRIQWFRCTIYNGIELCDSEWAFYDVLQPGTLLSIALINVSQVGCKRVTGKSLLHCIQPSESMNFELAFISISCSSCDFVLSSCWWHSSACFNWNKVTKISVVKIWKWKLENFKVIYQRLYNPERLTKHFLLGTDTLYIQIIHSSNIHTLCVSGN